MTDLLVAAVVTEETWEHPTRGTLTGRTAHASETCSRIRLGRIVGHGVDARTREAGLTCDYCWPSSDTAPERRGDRESPVSPPGPGVTARRDGQDVDTAPGGAAADRDGSEPRASSPAPPAAPARSGGRPNRYAGPCERCGSEVAAGSGLLVAARGGWGAVHRDGDCQPDAGRAANRAASGPLPDVPAGHYAVDGPRGLRFLRVTPRAAADLLAVPAGGRVLTDPESRTLGIGPECRGKGNR